MYLITDTTDLRDKDMLKDSYAKFKSGNSEDIKTIPHTSDFSGGASNLTKVTKGKRFFAQLTVSNKTINGRKYRDESVQTSATDGSWFNPYQRPLLKHHDSYSGETFGRVKDSFYVSHSTMGVKRCNDSSILPEKVLDFFKGKGAFSKGDGSTIVELDIKDADTAQKIIDGTYQTLSQSSCYEKMTCNICGEDYVRGNCSHWAGDEYEIKDGDATIRKTCVPEAHGKVEPVEFSIVNYPANDTSIFFVLDENETEDKKTDEKNSEKITDCKNTEVLNDTIEKETTVTDTDKQDSKKEEGSMDAIKELLLSKTVAIKDETLASEVKEFAKELEDGAFVKFLSLLEKLSADAEEPEKKDEEKAESTDETEVDEVKNETEEQTQEAEKKEDEKAEETAEAKEQPKEEAEDSNEDPAIKDRKEFFEEKSEDGAETSMLMKKANLWFK